MGVFPPWRQTLTKSLPLLMIIGARFVLLAMQRRCPRCRLSSRFFRRCLPRTPDLSLCLVPSSLPVTIIVFVPATAVASRWPEPTAAASIAAGGHGARGEQCHRIVDQRLCGRCQSQPICRRGRRRRAFAHGSVVGAVVVLTTVLFLLAACLPATHRAGGARHRRHLRTIKLGEIRAISRHDRLEGDIVAIAFFATLFLSVRLGLATGLASASPLLWFSSVPRVTRIGSDDGASLFVPSTGTICRLSPCRCSGSASIAGSISAMPNSWKRRFFRLIGRHESDEVECIVLDIRSVNGIDASGLAMLRRLTERLERADMTVHFPSPCAGARETQDAGPGHLQISPHDRRSGRLLRNNSGGSRR